MAQQKQKGKEDKALLDQALKLVHRLSPEDQEQLVEEMKLQWLKREVQKGIDQAERGKLIDGDVVFAELKKRYQTKSNQKCAD